MIPNLPLIVTLLLFIVFKPILISSGLAIPITNLCCETFLANLFYSGEEFTLSISASS